jgi:HSP20 family molecular chaperone IbpA
MSLIPSGLSGPGEFSSLFRLLDDYDSHRMGRLQTSAMQTFSPRFDVRESQEAYYLDGELPGVTRKDVDIEFSDPQTLIVKGHMERECQAGLPAEDEAETSANHRYWTWERSVGQFQRSFSFPSRVDQDAVKASLKNGILSVVIPKASADVSKRITVE